MTDILLDPNLAYLVLVSGVFLTLLALLSPGTGWVEVSALILLLFAGWEIYNLPINVWSLILLAAGLLPFYLSIRTEKLRHIWLGLSILAFVLGSAFLFSTNTWWKPAVNPILAFVVSLLLGSFIWIIATKTLQAVSEVPAHDLEHLIGEIGESRTPIHHDGSVYVNRELWSARSNVPIPAGQLVRVVGREGLILEVEPYAPDRGKNTKND